MAAGNRAKYEEALAALESDDPMVRLDGFFQAQAALQYEMFWQAFVIGQTGAMFELAKTDPAMRVRLGALAGINWLSDIEDLAAAHEVLNAYLRKLRDTAVSNLQDLDDADLIVAQKPDEADEDMPLEVVTDADFPWVVVDDNGIVDRFASEEDALIYIRESGDPTLNYMKQEED